MSGTTIDFATFACSSVEIADAFVGEFPAFNIVARNASSAVIEDKNKRVRITIDDADDAEWMNITEAHCSIVERDYLLDSLIEVGENYS